MKKKKCIIQLHQVPGHIIEETCGAIDSGMYLTPDAIKSALKGKMCSPVDFMWGYAGTTTERRAKKVCEQLGKYYIATKIIRIW